MQLEADSIGEGSPNQFPCPALTMAHIDDPAEQIKKSCIWIDDAIEKGMSATKIISHHYLNGSWSSNALMSAQPRKKAKTISTLSAYEHRAHSLHYSVSRRTHASTHVTDSSNLSKLLYHVVPGLASRWSAKGGPFDGNNGTTGNLFRTRNYTGQWRWADTVSRGVNDGAHKHGERDKITQAIPLAIPSDAVHFSIITFLLLLRFDGGGGRRRRPMVGWWLRCVRTTHVNTESTFFSRAGSSARWVAGT